MTTSLDKAKVALDSIIRKSRVHLYKPIQIAEILYKHRTDSCLNDLKDLEAYRNPSKRWRDIICLEFLGRTSTSSAKYQDNLFEPNAMPPALLEVLGKENKLNSGVVEAYIYKAFEDKHLQLNNALDYCLKSNKDSFKITDFLEQFWQQAGLKRSLDKVFEIVIYSLFEVLTKALEIKIDIYYEESQLYLIEEFQEFADKVLNLSPLENRKTLAASFHRVGVTNAADRGLDMYANFGTVVQVKHLSLDEELAEDVVTSITSDRIIIVCKDSEKKVIHSLLSQIGWRSRIQSIITINDLVYWYEKALRGDYSDILGENILLTLAQEIKAEFPSVGNNSFQEFKKERNYHKLQSDYWNLNSH